MAEKSARMCSNLFVYGTLRRGAANRFARLLAEHARFLGKARMAGRLYNLGRYPGAVRSGAAGEWVSGEVFRLDRPAQMLPVLDSYEGVKFERAMVRVRLASGVQVDAWVYFYRGQPRGLRIVSGEWLRRG